MTLFEPGDIVERIKPPPDGHTKYGVLGGIYTVHKHVGMTLHLKELKNEYGNYSGCYCESFRLVETQIYDPTQQPYDENDI